MRKITMAEATAKELRQFGETMLGLDFPNGSKAGDMLAKIKQVYDKDHFTLPEAAPQPVQAGSAPLPPAGHDPSGRALRGGSSKDDPVVELVINEHEDAGGKRPVPVGVNGVMMLIPRGKLVPVPYRYFLALQAAVKTTYSQNDDGDIIEANVPAYPYSVARMPSPAEIEAWERRTSGGATASKAA